MKTKVWGKTAAVAAVFLAALAAIALLARCETPPDPEVLVSPSGTTVAPGGFVIFTATVTGRGKIAQTVLWSIEEDISDSRTIITSTTSGGRLRVSDDETRTTLTVRATSTEYRNSYGTATVTVGTEPPVPVVTSVTVSPAAITLARGGEPFAFRAAVEGTENPAQTVTWAIVEPGVSTMTAITTTGVLTVAADESLDALTVRARSDADPDKHADAAVTVK